MNNFITSPVNSTRLAGILLGCMGIMSSPLLNAQTSSVEASNRSGSTSSDSGGGGGGGGGAPPVETFEAAFTLATSGKQLVANCAACHNLEIKAGDRTLKDGEVGTFRKGREYPVSIIDKPDVNRPNATVPPDHDTAKFTVWPEAADGQTITKTDDDKVFFVSKNEVVQYLIDNNELLFAQDKAWSDNLLSKAARLLPVDLDIVHPVTGELSDAKEDIDDGGYVSVQRLEDPADATSDVTPKTKLKIHAISGAQSTWKTRIKFSGADRFKVYRDEARTQEVLSEQTEFDATQGTTLFFHGLKKSVSRGGEQVTMQVKVNDAWVDGDSVKCTIVQGEFLIQVKAFIPYAWTEAEEEVPGPNGLSPMAGKVAKGDLHPGLGDRPLTAGFINTYSTDAVAGADYALFRNAPFRVCQKIILTPYKDLHPSYDLASGRKVWTAPSSDHYEKATSVDPTEITLKKGFKGLAGTPRSGKPPVKKKDFRQGSRTGKIAELHIEAGATDGAMGSILGIPLHWVTADIHWDMWVKIDSQANPLLPSVQFGGKHDSYPAYEIIVIQSDGTYKPIHNVSPAAGAYPGPSSLDDDNAINIGRSDTITQ